MSLAEHMETLNAALMAMRDIKYRGEIEEGSTDYPSFSDEQLGKMTIMANTECPHLKSSIPITTVKGHRIPYLNDREYMRIRDVGTFIRWRDVLVIIMEE